MLLFAVAIFFLAVFGITGLKVFLAVGILYFMPLHLILDNFDLDESEKLVFSFFLSLGIVPSLVYYLGFIFSSLKIAIVVTFLLLMGTSFVLGKFKKS